MALIKVKLELYMSDSRVKLYLQVSLKTNKNSLQGYQTKSAKRA